MKTLTITLVALLLLSASATRIPMFLGSGYNIFKGNPLSSDGVDRGFRYPIVELTYSGETTSDGNYEIPDDIYATKLSSCFLATRTTLHSGTASYQEELSVHASISGEYESVLYGGKFSLSADYKSM